MRGAQKTLRYKVIEHTLDGDIEQSFTTTQAIADCYPQFKPQAIKDYFRKRGAYRTGKWTYYTIEKLA